MIKKKLLLSILLLACTTSTMAVNKVYKGMAKKEETTVLLPACVPLFLLDGFYAGIGAGYTVLGLNENITSAQIPGINAYTRLAAKGLIAPEAVGGYGQYYGRFYIGGEAFIQASNADTNFYTSSTVSSYHLDVVTRTGMGVGILPGIRLNRTSLLYARIGYIRSFFSVRENGDVAGVPYGESETLWVNGLQFGIGVETTFSPYFSVRSDYTYARYSSFDTNYSAKISPNGQQLMMNLIYHFNY